MCAQPWTSGGASCVPLLTGTLPQYAGLEALPTVQAGSQTGLDQDKTHAQMVSLAGAALMGRAKGPLSPGQ